MDDLSTFIKKGFQKLHQRELEKDYKQKTIKDRRENYSNIRRKTRNDLVLQKRHIDINNLTPINTPESERKPVPIVTNIVDTTVVMPGNKRLEMLKKWKLEKEKRKIEEKKNSKPLFKVFHVPITVGLPNLENVNKEIKGKPIKNQNFVSKFAPVNHKFRPPINILPIHIQNTKLKNTPKMNSSVVKFSNNTSRVSTETHKTGAATTRSQSAKKNETLARAMAANKTPERTKRSKRGIMFDVVEIIESDNEVLTQEINTKTPQKKLVMVIQRQNVQNLV